MDKLPSRTGGIHVLGVELNGMPEIDGAADQGRTESALPFSREVGVRLRAVRRQRRLSLDDVERSSGGRWSASAIGAYERGFRNLSLPRLQELASFYDVPMAMLLGEVDVRETSDDRHGTAKIVLDLVALEGRDEAAPVLRYARSIVLDRGDWNGRVLSVRRDDVRALSTMLHTTETDLVAKLGQWNALVASSGPLAGDEVVAL
ncbi:MAG: helix-turn-helix domain protein [Acidimicrobiales bacterium]|nr:helix-turn-helix domain protein [Acidimicrobiales bacterium]